jgi:hypothetical protein
MKHHVFIPGAVEKYSIEPDLPYIVLGRTEVRVGEEWATVIWNDGFVGAVPVKDTPGHRRITLWTP